MNITVAGIGYVGLSNALLLAKHNSVIALDISSEKIAMLNRGDSPIIDKEKSGSVNTNAPENIPS